MLSTHPAGRSRRFRDELMTQYGLYESGRLRPFIQFQERNFPPFCWTGIQEKLSWSHFLTMWNLLVNLVWKSARVRSRNNSVSGSSSTSSSLGLCISMSWFIEICIYLFIYLSPLVQVGLFAICHQNRLLIDIYAKYLIKDVHKDFDLSGDISGLFIVVKS